jgi:uncharacterized protein YjbI with pentapeptide repeats
MANQAHFNILKQGVESWNQWRKKYADIRPDLVGVHFGAPHFSKPHLIRADLSNVNLSGANLMRVDLREANLSRADLSHVNFVRADLSYANLSHADLSRADLKRANLTEANLSNASLSEADMGGTLLVETNLAEAILTHCRIFGIAAWGVDLKGTIQNNLIISRWDEPTITVDNLKVAQFIYLLLNNAEIRDVIDTITSKVVLILGSFTPPRKAILDVLRETLRSQGYVPILFDFDKPASRDLTETVSTHVP